METNPKKSLNVQAMIIAGMLGVLFIAGWAFLKFFL